MTCQIKTVGDLYRLIKQCDELQARVTAAEDERSGAYDPCGYLRGLEEEAERERDAFFGRILTLCRDPDHPGEDDE